jgi:hypothetical protein
MNVQKTKPNLFKRISQKLHTTQWTIGFFQGNIEDIIASKSFNPNVKWLPTEPFKRSFADPFIFKTTSGKYHALVEDVNVKENYGRISLMEIDEKTLKPRFIKILLDTNSHLSYPFLYKENNKLYIFPEAGLSGKLSCYEYDQDREILNPLQVIMDYPIVDPTIIKYNNKYWLFGTLKGKESFNKLYIFFSDSLLGPYKAHQQNPVKNSYNGTRPAGNFIKIGNTLYRPAQNCETEYGESITINKVNILDEENFSEEIHMVITIDEKSKTAHNIHTIHTINAEGNLIAIDGKQTRLSPFLAIKDYLKSKTK